MEITRGTRKNILDTLTVEGVRWFGRLDDVGFLSRVFDLDETGSLDRRFRNARDDIWQHRVNNADWEDDWVYTDSRFDLLGCSDDLFLGFLCEMVHPVVRPDPTEMHGLVELLNDHLRVDGYQLFEITRIGDRPVWAARRQTLAGTAGLSGFRAAKLAFDADYITQQINRMETAIEGDPSLAIGTAKELVEAACKAILEERNRAAPPKTDLPKLVRLVSEELGLLPEAVAPDARAAETIKKVLGSLASIVAGVAELRNQYGTGHGPAPSRGSLGPRHAKLASGAASTLAVFLYETHQDRGQAGRPKPPTKQS